MAESGGAAEEERRGSWRFLRGVWIFWLLAGVFAVALIVAVLSQRGPSGPPRVPRLDVNDLAQVLAYGELPRTFLFDGMAWQAVEVKRIDKPASLARVGTTLGDTPVYHERSEPTAPYRSLYLPVARSGPNSDVYVRCNPGG